MSSPGCYQDMLLTLSPFPRRFVDSWLYTVIVSILHALRSLTTSLSSSRPRAPICPGPSRFPPVSPSCTFPRPSPPPLPLSTRQRHLLLQTVHPHHVPEEQDFLLYVDTTGLLAVIPISLHWVFTSGLYLSDLFPPIVVLFSVEYVANWKSKNYFKFLQTS